MKKTTIRNLDPVFLPVLSRSKLDELAAAAAAKHTCHAKGCDVLVPPTMLMCKRHWRMVPRQLRLGVWRWYRPGQESAKNPTRQYLAAANSAIQAVADKERERAAKLAAKHPEFDFGPEPE